MSAFDQAMQVADAVLSEGHVLYPYRPSALKNRMRWQFGVLGPPTLAARPGADGATCRVEVVTDAPAVAVRVRFLHVTGVDESGWQQTEVVTVDCDGDATFAGGRVRVEHLGPFVAVTVENTSTFDRADAERDDVLAASLIAVHVMLAATSGTFASATDPAPAVAELVRACRQDRLWPVLMGPGVVLACPIILYDNPTIAPESVGEWGDATEIEEMLALRVLTLTDEERAAAVRADAFGAAVIGQATPASLGSLHGRLRVGASVVLRPGPGADAHDLFLDGKRATVVGHVVDAEGTDHVQVLVDDDPGRDLHEWFGRSWYFRPDEVEPVDEDPAS